MADTNVETSSDLNQDSLDGAQASVSEVGSAEEFAEKDNTEDTPSGSHGEAEEETSSREADDVTAAKENGDAVKENGEADVEHHVNGNGNGEAEADSTEVDGSVGEKRKSVVESEAPLTISPKKARIEGAEDEVDAPAAEAPVEEAANGQAVA